MLPELLPRRWRWKITCLSFSQYLRFIHVSLCFRQEEPNTTLSGLEDKMAVWTSSIAKDRLISIPHFCVHGSQML